jgi:hypothetical protein
MNRLHDIKIINYLDVTRRSVFLFKNNISDTGLCLRSQIKAYSFGPNR